jgi:hypothetical protein
MIVYTVTVIDLVGDLVLGNRSTPAIFTTFEAAYSVVRNNEKDISDNSLYQYAVIEETYLNVVRPDLEIDTKKHWFKYNTALEEFEPYIPNHPHPVFRLSGFGIG